MKKNLLLLFALMVSFSTFAAFTPPAHYLVSYQLKYTYSKDSLIRFWKKSHIPQVAVKVKNAVDMYEVTYKGQWLDSTFIVAKGVLYVPKTDKPSAEMVYCHGTRISVQQSPGIQDLEQVVCMMHAVDGYIAMFPYYYGLGGGEKEHIYHDTKTEAYAAIYMVKACREIYPQLNKTTTGQLFITGYSQGGHAAMAATKVLDSGEFPEVKLTASSPMSGAYDLTGEQAKTMFRQYDQPHYLPYLLISYQYAYHVLTGDIYKIFNPPYDTLLRDVFAQPREKDFGYVNSILPKVPKDMIVDSLVKEFQNNPDYVFTKKLKENSLARWVPTTPLQICACYGDNEVMYQNTEVAYDYMKQHTNQVYKRVFGKHLSHNPCAPFAILYSKYFFDNFRKGRKHPERIRDGKRFILALGISIANQQAKKHLKKYGKVEGDAMASRKGKK